MRITSRYLSYLLYAFIPYCFIDLLNGFFSFKGVPLPISQLYKLGIIILLLPLLLKSASAIFISVFLVTGLVYQVSLYTVDISEDIAVLMRNAIFVLSVIGYYNCRGLFNSNHLSILRKVFLINFIVLSVSIIGGLFGIGMTTYGNYLASSVRHLGFKSFFIAGNELGALIVCLFPFIVLYFNKVYSKSLVLISFLLVSILIGTKTPILAVLIMIFVSFIFHFRMNRSLKFASLSFFVFLILFICYFSYNILQEKFELLLYFYEERGWLYLVLSGRNNMMLDAMNFVAANFTFFDYIFGVGSSYAASQVKSVEIDFADLFIWNGLIWMLFVHFFYIGFAIIVYRIVPKGEKLLISTMLALIFFASTIAGHIFTSGMLLPIISLSLPYAISRKREYEASHYL